MKNESLNVRVDSSIGIVVHVLVAGAEHTGSEPGEIESDFGWGHSILHLYTVARHLQQ